MNKFYNWIFNTEKKFNRIMLQAELEARLIYQNAFGFSFMDFDLSIEDIQLTNELKQDLEDNIDNISNNIQDEMGKRKNRKHRKKKTKHSNNNNISSRHVSFYSPEGYLKTENKDSVIKIETLEDVKKLLGRDKMLQLTADYCSERVKGRQPLTDLLDYAIYQINHNIIQYN